MKAAVFSVTYDIVTAESAEHGEPAESGFIVESARLREAINELNNTRTCAVDGVADLSADSSPCTRPRWITVTNGMEFYTGAQESRSLHIPDSVTTASARRIARLVGVAPSCFRPYVPESTLT